MSPKACRPFPLALARLIDRHLDRGATIHHVAISLRLQLAAFGETLDQNRRYRGELMTTRFPLMGGGHVVDR